MQGYGRGFTAIQRASDNVIEEDVLNSSYLSGAPKPQTLQTIWVVSQY